jgi:hypothetical protein
MRDRVKRWLWVALPVLGLALVLALLLAGWSPGRWLPVAGFLSVGVAALLYDLVVVRLAKQRARRNRVAWNVVLRKPVWLQEHLFLIWVGAMVAAVAAAIGFPGVGMGLGLAFAGSYLFLLVLSRSVLATPKLELAHAGLWVGLPQVRFLVPWTAITAVSPLGDMVRLRLLTIESILVSVEPDTTEARNAIRGLVLDSQLLLAAWAGGLDSETLAKAIVAAKRGRTEPLN